MELLSYVRKKFINTNQYVSLTENNFNTTSNEFAMLIQAIGAELDSVFKVFCGYNFDDKLTITNYANNILNTYQEITQEEISVLYTDIKLKPFSTWNVEKPAQSLLWWSSFDNIKHRRANSIEFANLSNTMNILAALFLLEMKYIKNEGSTENERDIPEEESNLFELKNWTFNTINMSNIYAKVIDTYDE